MTQERWKIGSVESTPSGGWSRRQLLGAGAAGALAPLTPAPTGETAATTKGSLPPASPASSVPHARRQAAPAWPSDPEGVAAYYADNIYTRLLGVRPHLPAHEAVSRLGGGRMSAEVVAAMAEANDFFVDMNELNLAAGRRIAELMGAESATVTAGAFSAMLLGAAACLTGVDEEKMEALPHPHWAKTECLIQTPHRFDYDRAYRAAGMTIVEAATREDFVAKISERTAMISVLVWAEKQTIFAPPLPVRRVQRPGPEVMLPEELIEVGKQHGVPVLVDMASNIPPRDNLTRFIEAGADLVVVSGGKAIRGPGSTGILAGRADLIEAARLNANPNDNIGRGMKIGKEEIVGLVVGARTIHGARLRGRHPELERRRTLAGRRAAGHSGADRRHRGKHHGLRRCRLELGSRGDPADRR